LKLERAACRIQAVQRGRQQRRVPLKKRKVAVNGEKIEQDSRVRMQTAKDLLLRRSRGRGIQMRIVDSSLMKNNSVNDVTSMWRQQQHQPHKEVGQRPPQRPSSARRRRHQRSRPSPRRRPASASTTNRRGRPSPVTEGSAWGGLSLRAEVRQKLITLQRGPYARRPENKDLLPGYGAASARDLQIQLARRDVKGKGKKKVGRLTHHSPSSSPIKAVAGYEAPVASTTTVVLKPSSKKVQEMFEMKDEEPDGREVFFVDR
jgi:hypothetical protein